MESLLYVICYYLGRTHCQHSIPRFEHEGEGNIQNTAPAAEHDGRSAETDRWPEGGRIFTERRTPEIKHPFLRRIPPQL